MYCRFVQIGPECRSNHLKYRRLGPGKWQRMRIQRWLEEFRAANTLEVQPHGSRPPTLLKESLEADLHRTTRHIDKELKL
ncbi:hypothetical protein COOONC_19690 [Cooperia oncophora]